MYKLREFTPKELSEKAMNTMRPIDKEYSMELIQTKEDETYHPKSNMMYSVINVVLRRGKRKRKRKRKRERERDIDGR